MKQIGSGHFFSLKLSTVPVILAVLLPACASTPFESYNTTGPTGTLERQELTFDGNVCHYSTGLTIYTQKSCPASVQSNVYTR